MGYCKDPFHMNRQAKKGMKHMETIFKIGAGLATAAAREVKAQQREHARQQAAQQRFLLQEERNRLRLIKDNEAAMRRAERERAKAERERQRLAVQQAALEAQERLEAEIAQIEEENELWTNVHSYSNSIVTVEDINQELNKCKAEKAQTQCGSLFKKDYPKEEDCNNTATNEAVSKFNIYAYEQAVNDAKKELDKIETLESEPTLENVREELVKQAKIEIKSFWPWKQNKLRKEFVESSSERVFQEKHKIWKDNYTNHEKLVSEALAILETKQKEYNDKIKERETYIITRAKELFSERVSQWTKERDEFFDVYERTMRNVLDGDRNYVLNAIQAAFANDAEELPMEYFVDIAYDEINGRILVDLDLPEIEDIPENKVTTLASGKQTIKAKSQTNVKEDYANCVCGLSIYIASIIFNVSLKIKEVEISGFTQRLGNNSAIATDQYILLINFNRELFQKIKFENYTSLEAIDFFKHHIDMTKSFVMKEINLNTAFEKMETFIPAIYTERVSQPQKTIQPSTTETTARNNTIKKSSVGGTSNKLNDTPQISFKKAESFVSDIYDFIDRLSRDLDVNKHADNLNGVQITFTGGGFKGDGDVNTYRGKLFFCAAVDLYRSLENMNISFDYFVPASYPFALFLNKVYSKANIEFHIAHLLEQPYKAYADMLKPMANGFPMTKRFFLLGEVLYDYEKDLSWYKSYLEIMKKHIDIVEGSIQNSQQSLENVMSFKHKLKIRGINF